MRHERSGNALHGVRLFGEVDLLAEHLDRVDEADDGGVDREGFHAGGLAGRAALAEQHELADAGAERVDGDDGVRSRRGIARGWLSSTSMRAKQEQFRPRMVSSFLVETMEPMTRARNMAS